MVDEAALLAALAEALRAGPDERPPAGELVLVRRGLRRRSTIYFVGDGGVTPARSAWVVKRPSPEANRLGIRPPMSAEDQYVAMKRLYEFVADGRAPFDAPRPVAVLPDFGALAMEFVEGRSVWELVEPSALLRPRALEEGVRAAGLVLRHLHAIEPASTELVDPAAVSRSILAEARVAAGYTGAAPREAWFSPQPGLPEQLEAKVVLLHGDWAPENLLLHEDQVFCLDPELTDRGWPEQDLARFLLMLLDRSLFVSTGAVGVHGLAVD